VKAFTTSRETITRKVKVTAPVQENKALNNPPKIEGLVANIEVNVPLVEDENIFKYISPVATDSEGDKIFMAFDGIDSLPFLSVKKGSDDTFTLRVDKSLVSKVGTSEYKLTVTLSNEGSLTKTTYNIKIIISKEEPIVVEEEVESTTVLDQEVIAVEEEV